jgi:hypothetical protein
MGGVGGGVGGGVIYTDGYDMKVGDYSRFRGLHKERLDDRVHIFSQVLPARLSDTRHDTGGGGGRNLLQFRNNRVFRRVSSRS